MGILGLGMHGMQAAPCPMQYGSCSVPIGAGFDDAMQGKMKLKNTHVGAAAPAQQLCGGGQLCDLPHDARDARTKLGANLLQAHTRVVHHIMQQCRQHSSLHPMFTHKTLCAL